MASKAEKARELEEFRAEQTFHEREWLVQRIAWALLAVFVVAGMAGLFGGGPLSKRTLRADAGTLEIERFARRSATEEWTIRPAAAPDPNAPFTLRISSSFLERYEITSIVPEPESTTLSGREVSFVFDASAPDGAIVFHVEPGHLGPSEGSFALGGAAPVRVRQFVYP